MVLVSCVEGLLNRQVSCIEGLLNRFSLEFPLPLAYGTSTSSCRQRD